MAKLKCANCNKELGCGCERRKATDGKSCCSTCINIYQKILNNAPQQNPVLSRGTINRLRHG